MTKTEILDLISDFFTRETIPFDTVNEQQYSFDPIKDYIKALKAKVKPETATSMLLISLFRDLFKGEVTPEVNIEGSFIDFILRDAGNGNPICIELKPLFVYTDSKNALTRWKFNYHEHQKQIQTYLSKRNVEYVILTNVEQAYIFNRSALIKYEPFSSINFVDLFRDYLNTGNLWDVIKRYEDDAVVRDLDYEFFNDLKKWYNEFANVQFIKNQKFSREEIVVLFLNKFIFIKTLEDYGLIPYRFIQTEFENTLKKWEVKGNEHVFADFFYTIEKFFQNFYDTELFDYYFWDYIDKNKANLNHFRKVFELIIGLDNWSNTFGKGLVHYNYRKINEDIFGKAYETWIAENRKDEGIYYTPASITYYMADLIVDALFEQPVNELIDELKKSDLNIQKVKKLTEKIISIKIIDSTSGSGSFLIKVLRRIHYHYEKLKKSTDWANDLVSHSLHFTPDNVKFVDEFRQNMDLAKGSALNLISKIIIRHIYGADKDERAIDTAKTNIWKEAVKLNPQIYNSRYLQEDKEHILPNLELNFIKGDSLSDLSFEEQIEFIAGNFQNEIAELQALRNSYLSDVFKPAILDKAKTIKQMIREKLSENCAFKDALFFPLEFFYCFFAEDGTALPMEQRGFDGIISNPPWEAIKPVKKEFAKQGKYEMNVLQFNKWFESQLKFNETFRNDWLAYTDNYKKYSQYLYSKYSHQSSGDPNFYKFFMERDFQIIKNDAFYCLLVPSGFQTDEGANLLRKLLIEDYTLIELSSFENRGYYYNDENTKTKLFPDVDNRFKFSVVFARKSRPETSNYKFRAKFYLHDPADLNNDNFILYDIEKIKQFSPNNLSIMEFKSDYDYEICSKIRDGKSILAESGIKLRREFDMTNDSRLFKTINDLQRDKGKPHLRLYEGKMIHQYNAHFSQPRYFIDEAEGREILLRKVMHRIKSESKLSSDGLKALENLDDLILDYQTYRLVYRAIGSSTNERTLISTIVPKNVVIGHSMNHVVNVDYSLKSNYIYSSVLNYSELIYFMTLLNSLTLNYYIRNKISANLTMNFIYELPFAEADAETKRRLIELGFNLLYLTSNKSEFEELRTELGLGIPDVKDKAKIRAEIETIIARDLYGLSLEEWKHITSTFTYGEGSDTKAEMDDFIEASFDSWY